MGGRNGAHGPRSRGRPRKYPQPSSAFSAWLKEWLEVDGNTIHGLGRSLGISPSTVYNLRNGYFPPGRQLAISIARESGGAVPVDSWDPK